ncbi:hypothetical protein [Mahella australiensis]|uniref:Replication-relaxation n=1 Tax=Mahella australiensis (strain DSM 15567 / CIP 107919 / 50-1 BON) TaxID=697281 RepID=F4A0E4_MAHA5|nr:hypothetical protein [Mahella australiensis]AEE98005.1 hypothetical protein Mahau_2883 [Mahella australiensis 50-1 BON]
MMKNIVMTQRDIKILLESIRWKFLLARQIKYIGGFKSDNALYRRLRMLIDARYLKRLYTMYGVPAVYITTSRGKKMAGLDTMLSPVSNVSPVSIRHDICVVDAAIYLAQLLNVSFSEMQTEREIRKKQGYELPEHVPDIVISAQGICVEVELTQKTDNRLKKIISDEYRKYDRVIYVVPNASGQLYRKIKNIANNYPTVEIIELEVIEKYAKGL